VLRDGARMAATPCVSQRLRRTAAVSVAISNNSGGRPQVQNPHPGFMDILGEAAVYDRYRAVAGAGKEGACRDSL
jgi:hypothetical protein